MLFSLLKHYLDLYVTDTALKLSQSLYCFSTSISHVLKTISPGCGVRTSLMLIVSTGSIRWILWFSVRYAAAARREIFGVNALRGKQQQLGSPNLQDIFIGG